MSEVSDEVIMKWAKEKYPEFAGNLKLMRMLYEKEHGRGRRDKREIEYIETKIEEAKKMKDWTRVKVIVLVADYAKTFSYMGCPECRRKNCSCGLEKVKYVRKSYWVGDETGIIKVYMPWRREEEEITLEIGKKYIIKGKVETFNDKRMLVADEVEEYDDEGKEIIEKVLKELKPTKKLLVDVFDSYVKRKYGLSFDDFKDYVKIEEDDGGRWVVFE